MNNNRHCTTRKLLRPETKDRIVELSLVEARTDPEIAALMLTYKVEVSVAHVADIIRIAKKHAHSVGVDPHEYYRECAKENLPEIPRTVAKAYGRYQVL